MCEARERLFRDLQNRLILSDIPSSYIEIVSNIFVDSISYYDVSDKCTDVAVIDTADERIIKLYAGSLLTEGKSKKTVKIYVSVLNTFMKEVGKHLLDVDVFDVRVWLANKQNKVTLRTCENYRSYLSAFYKWLEREEYIVKNPMAKIKPIKYVDEVRKPFSEVELDALRHSCKTKRERAILEMLLSSGARVSELCAMDIDDIDFTTLEVIIREGKGGKQRKTYITQLCKKHVIDYLNTRTDDKSCLIYSQSGDRITNSGVENILNELGKRSEVENTHPHRCRRTFATRMAKSGMDIRTIQILMGHSDLNTTMKYITLSDDRVGNEYRRYA